MKEQLNDLEVKKIEQFCKDEKMFDAVRKVLLSGLYSHGVIKAGEKHNPLENGAFSLAALAPENPITDEVLGQHIRGMWAGINALEVAYKKLTTINSKKEETETPSNNAI